MHIIPLSPFRRHAPCMQTPKLAPGQCPSPRAPRPDLFPRMHYHAPLQDTHSTLGNRFPKQYRDPAQMHTLTAKVPCCLSPAIVTADPKTVPYDYPNMQMVGAQRRLLLPIPEQRAPSSVRDRRQVQSAAPTPARPGGDLGGSRS